MKHKKNQAVKLICPFTPWMDAHGRSTTCLADRCIQWEWEGRKSQKDPENLERVGFCGLNNYNKMK